MFCVFNITIFKCSRLYQSLTGKRKYVSATRNCLIANMWIVFITICLFRSTAQQECLSCDKAISAISRETRGTSDNLGATLSYACTRTGFKPTGPENYTCEYKGGAAIWSDNLDTVLPTAREPMADCPSKKIINVVDRTETVYHVSDWKTQFYQEVDAHTTELLSIVPESVTSYISKIGASEEIVVTVGFTYGANVGEEAQCKFRVFYEAGACFEENLFSDSFATTDCTDTGEGGLECTRTCSNGYVFGNGGTSSTFICSYPNTWNFDQADPTDRYCLPIQNSDDTIDVYVIYYYGYLSQNCYESILNKVEGELSTFENNIQSSCNLNWDAQVLTIGLIPTAKFSATLKLTRLSSATTIEKKKCFDIIRNNTALFNFGINSLKCGAINARIDVVSAYTGDVEVTCQESYHFKLTSADLAVEICGGAREPMADCPSKKIINVVDRTETVYHVSDWKTQFYQEVDAHTTELLSIVPESVTSYISKIGASEEIVVTVGFTYGANVGEEAQCKFRVFYEAGACFEENLFSDSFATTDCTDTGEGGLECTRTCSNGYVFGNGGTSSTFICSYPNTWNFDQADPTDRYCLPIQNSDDTIDVYVIYYYGYLSQNCYESILNKVEGELSTFENNIQSSCNLNWDAQVLTIGLIPTAKFSATLKLTRLSSATTIEKKKCFDIIRNNTALFNFGINSLKCGAINARIDVVSAYTGDVEVTCQESYHFKLTSADLAVEICGG
ncbi:hypothetical protein MAR_027937 [Mya arenaria]|uniref:Sushi domain-containing protein n=1 Tax=Mya arenaria TaxID=6604 RepID=A0ABY7DC63_MYAAR|nr:hypothetical protein MAR_027937 [Mya arenaria]